MLNKVSFKLTAVDGTPGQNDPLEFADLLSRTRGLIQVFQELSKMLSSAKRETKLAPSRLACVAGV